MDVYWRLEKQTDGAGRKSVVSPPEYRGDVGRRWTVGVVVDWGGGVLKHLEHRLERKHMKSISASLSPGLLPPPPYFPLCHLREVSQCCGEGPSPAPIINGIIGAYGIT